MLNKLVKTRLNINDKDVNKVYQLSNNSDINIFQYVMNKLDSGKLDYNLFSFIVENFRNEYYETLTYPNLDNRDVIMGKIRNEEITDYIVERLFELERFLIERKLKVNDFSIPSSNQYFIDEVDVKIRSTNYYSIDLNRSDIYTSSLLGVSESELRKLISLDTYTQLVKNYGR